MHIFRKVVDNILHSVKKIEESGLNFILSNTCVYGFSKIKHTFGIADEIKVPGAIDVKEKFLIYRLPDEFLTRILTG